MRIVNTLTRDDARRIARHLGMTDFSDSLTPFGASAERKSFFMRNSRIKVEDTNGQPVALELTHLHLEKLDSMPDDLRRRLLSAGHVYVRTDRVMSVSVQMAECGHGALFVHDSEAFGANVGIGYYTKTEPDIEALGLSDMGQAMGFYRVMPEAYGNEYGHGELMGADSDLRLYVDLGAIEAVAFQEVSCGVATR